jgi:hypothetical protein
MTIILKFCVLSCNFFMLFTSVKITIQHTLYIHNSDQKPTMSCYESCKGRTCLVLEFLCTKTKLNRQLRD